MPKTTITLYGGVNEIGGNKVAIRDRDTQIMLDFGATFNPVNYDKYFVEWLEPRDRFGLKDYFFFDMVPRIPGLYSQEALERTDMKYTKPQFQGVFLSHVHFDHASQISWVDPKIPVHVGKGTKLILDSIEAVGGSLASYGEHDYTTFRTGSKVKIDDLEVVPIHVDHSVPAAYGYIVHTSEGPVAYTGDVRLHGPHAQMTRDFIEAAAGETPIAMVCEGTRVAPQDTRQNMTEAQVKAGAKAAVAKCKKRVITTFYPRDVDRMRTFYQVAKETGRSFVVSAKTAHLLKTLAADSRIDVPDVLGDPEVMVYFREMARPYKWETELAGQVNAVGSDYIRKNQSKVVLQLGFYQFTELIDILPEPGSLFIHSMSEPFEDGDVEEEVKMNWIKRFGLNCMQLHASGHAAMGEIFEMVDRICPKTLVPIHTEHPTLFKKTGKQVELPDLGRPVGIHRCPGSASGPSHGAGGRRGHGTPPRGRAG
ncbi:MAG: MBL fold metallo-hydrolase [Halobacteria archaeon]